MNPSLTRQPDHDADPFSTDAMPRPAGVPGKSTLTSRLPAPVVLRVESGERGPARDANGVAAGADAAVEQAAGGSGQALPAELRGRFEASLGADLSGVRVHTSSASAEAAHAVGAHAYTVGQDIHFGAGKYDTTSSFGVHLLAHEVAHTVQQAGSAPTMQPKLEVSAPHDALETEADRAADAMVAGVPAMVSAFGGGAARKVLQRDSDVETTADAVDKNVRAAERAERDEQVKPSYSPGSVLSNRYSQKEARSRLTTAQQQTAALEQHATMGTDKVTWDMVSTNHKTIDELSTYADLRDSEATDLGSLVTSQNALRKDFARLNAAVGTVMQDCGLKPSEVVKGSAPENPADHTKPLGAEGQAGQKLGEAIGDGMTGGDKVTGKSANLAELRVLTNNAIADYHKSIADVNSSSTGVKEASSKLKASTASLTHFNLKQENKELTSELQAAQAEAKGVADSVSAVTGLVVACAGITGGLSSAAGGNALVDLKPSIEPALKAVDGKLAEGSLSTVNDLITQILLHTSGIQKKISNVTGALTKNELAQLREEKKAQGEAVAAAAAALDKAIQDHKKHVADAEARKQTMRTAVSDYGARLDAQAVKDGTGSGARFEVVGKVMGECDAFIGQCNLVWQTIKSYRSSASTAKDQRNAINEAIKGGDGHRYGLPLWWIELVPATTTHHLVQCENIHLGFSGSEAGGKSADVRPQDAVDSIERDVKTAGSMAYGMRGQLAVFMGLNLGGTQPEFMS
jgi:hypothetical protein